MIKSFRLRLALLSALLAGLALAAFGLSTIWLVRSLKIERIDNEVRAIAERESGRPRDAEEWPATERKLLGSLGVREPANVLLLVQGAGGATLYRSTHWPDALEPNRLEWPTGPGPRRSTSLVLPFISDAQAQEPPPHRPFTQAPQERRPPDGGPAYGRRPPRADRPPRPGEEDYRRGPAPERDYPSADRPPPRRMGVPNEPRFEPPRAQTSPPANTIEAPRAPVASPAPASPPETSPPGSIPSRLAPPSPPPPPLTATTSYSAHGQTWRIGLARTDDLRVAVAVNADIIEPDMRSIRNAYLLAMPFALVLVGAGGWFFSGRALKPLHKLTQTARRINAEGLHQRISSQGEDQEFSELIEVFNRMLGRLERSFRQAYRFSADAAHELKTPLAILQGQLERAIQNAEDGSPMQAELTGILDEVRHLSTISRKLLLLSQADAGQLNLHLEPFDLSRVLQDLVEDTRMLAPHLQLKEKIQPGLTILADSGLLRQVLHNLISNAIKYNVPNGTISFATARWGQRVEVTIANSSTGIPQRDEARIFERFYRADPARGRQVDGVGLGLSVSREIARAHGGDLTLKSNGKGLVEFSLILSGTTAGPFPSTGHAKAATSANTPDPAVR